MPRPIRATISSAALKHNLDIARRYAAGSKVWAVIKANGYGHGLLRVAKALEAADGFALLDMVDALRLRSAGVSKPILMLEGFFKPQDLPFLEKYALTPVVHSLEQVQMLKASDLGGQIDAYLKINSGMNRLGFAPDNVLLGWNSLQEDPQIRSVTLMTHFADADGESGVRGQLDWFDEITHSLDAPRSVANSAALLRYPEETRAAWVRPGIMLYGCSPFLDQSAASFGLQPAMTLSSEIIALQRLQPGERVGYGFSYETAGEMTVGVVACGYADGYPRHAPTGTPVLVAGQRARVVGRVSMDMLCVDVTGIEAARVGAPVTLWGEGLSADEVAMHAGTLSYQLLCALAPRVPVVEI
jgi:alanine racemase